MAWFCECLPVSFSCNCLSVNNVTNGSSEWDEERLSLVTKWTWPKETAVGVVVPAPMPWTETGEDADWEHSEGKSRKGSLAD